MTPTWRHSPTSSRCAPAASGARTTQLVCRNSGGLRGSAGVPRVLSPTQALLADAVFFLRNRLDPVGNPGDFRALVGSIYDPGQYAVLTRGSSDWARAPLNIGGLWSDEPQLEGGALHEARREVLLYLILLEPGLAPAIKTARALSLADGP